MNVIKVNYTVVRDDKILYDKDILVEIEDRWIDDATEFVRDNPTGELVDLPIQIYAQCNDTAMFDAMDYLKSVGDELLDLDEIWLEQYIPSDLLKLLPEDVQKLLPHRSL